MRGTTAIEMMPTDSSCSSLYNNLKFISGLQYMEEEGEEDLAKPPPTKWVKTTPMAAATALTTATEGEGAIPKDTTPPGPTPSTLFS